MHDAIAFVDRSGGILLTNREQELPAPLPSVRMTELGERFEIFRPDGQPYQATEWPVLRAARTGEVIVDEEFFRLLPDGSRRSFSCNCGPFYDDRGAIAGAVLVARDITDEKRSQEQLSYLLPMLNHTEDAIIAFDPDWHVTAWNKGAVQMYGWSTEEVLGRELQSLMRADMSDEQRAEYRREIVERGRWRGEVAVARNNGLIVWIESINVAIRDEHGEITGYLAIHRDISERRQAEDALRDAQRRAETILDSIGEDFFALDREWRYTYVNERGLAKATQIPGVRTAADLLGKNIWQRFPQLVGTTFDHEAHRAMRDRTAVDLEEYSPVTGRWMHARIYPSQEGLSIYLHDITERRRAEQQRTYHSWLLENMDDAVLATDEKFVLRAWNRGAERMFGWTADEAVGRLVDELISTSFSDEELAAEMASLVESGRWRGAGTWYGKHGKPVQAEANNVALSSDEGAVTGYMCIMRDLSERMRSQQELERRIGQQAAVAKLGLKALVDGGLQALMDEASKLACRGLAVEYAKVDELLPDGRELLVRAGAGWPEGVIGSVVMPAGRGSPAGYALLTGVPVIVDDVSAETRFEVPAVLREHDVMSDITVPIDSGGQQFGTLAALSTKRRSFSDHDISFVQSVANVLANAFERAESDQRLEAVREAERSRIARDLHDAALSELTEALALATLVRSDPTEERTDAILASLRGVAQQVRAAVYDLRFTADEERDFTYRLEELIAIQAGMATDLNVSLRGRERLPSGSVGHVGTEVLRIVQEAVTNARRHSGAAMIRVDAARSTPDVLRLDVSDDGKWPDREATVSSLRGTGITGMVERARSLHATLRIGGRPRGGTEVSLELTLGSVTGGSP